MKLNEAINILSNHRNKLVTLASQEDRMATNPILDAIDVVIESYKKGII